MSTTSIATDREARRKARYRGNPERARFHRQHEAGKFEIKVRDDQDRNGSKSKNTDAVRDANGELPVSLVRGLRRVSINELADTYTLSEPRESMAPIVEQSADGINSNYNRSVSSVKSLMSGMKPGKQTRSLIDNETQRACGLDSGVFDTVSADFDDSAERAEHSEDDSGIALEQASDSESELENSAGQQQKIADVRGTANISATIEPNKLHCKGNKELKAEKPEKSRKRQQRPRKKDIDVKNIESVLQEAPTRMTRSMAKKIGVETPRRYFGEGVSTSQILRPAKPAATQKPKREL